MTSDGTRTIVIDYLARIEGESALHVTVDGGRVTDVELRIFEPPRLFEALLRGRRMIEAPDLTARICGICPVAYQMSAVHAIERACGVTVGGQLRALRRLLYCGEWIESHALHIYMLHAPDFLAVANVVELARLEPRIVERGLELKRVGNDIIALLGGREIHPVNVKVGGFYRVPTRSELRTLAERVAVARGLALDTVRWVADFEFPDHAFEPEYVALRHDDEYPMCEGRIVSTAGLDIDPGEFDDHFVETHAPRSNALHCRLRARGSYLAGPLARFRINFDRLTPLAQQAASDAGARSRLHEPVPQHRRPRRGDRLCVRRGRARDRGVRAARGGCDRGAAARGDRRGLHRGATRAALSCLRARGRRADPEGDDRPADLAEPAVDRGRHPGLPQHSERPPGRAAPRALRAAGSQSRSVYLVRDALLEAHGRPVVNEPMVIGVGHPDRGDDAVGPMVVRAMRDARPAGARFLELRGDPLELLEIWTGARVILVDATRGAGAAGQIVRLAPFQRSAMAFPIAAFVSSHAVDLGVVVELASALGRVPNDLVLFGVEGARFGQGEPPSDCVRAAVPRVVEAVLQELARPM